MCTLFRPLPVGGRHASRNVAETLRCDFFLAKNLDCVQWHCPYEKQCNENWVECCFLRDSAEGYRQKILKEVGHMIKCDNVIACFSYTFALYVFGRHADGWSRTAKTVRCFFHNDVAFSCFWRSLLSLSPFCWVSVDWVQKAMFWKKVSTRSTFRNASMETCSAIFILWQACQQEHCRRDRQVWMKGMKVLVLSVFIGRGRLCQNKGNENHLKTHVKTTWNLKSFWKLVKESKVIWCVLHWTDLLRCPLFSCLIFSGQLTCRCPSWVSAKTFRHSFPVFKGSR